MIRNVNEIRQNLVKITISKIFEPTFRSITFVQISRERNDELLNFCLFVPALALACLEREDQVSRALFKPRARSFYIYIYISNTKPRGGMNQNQGK